MNTEQVTQRIRQVRTQLNLSQEQLAGKLNVSFATINRWEQGKSKPQKAQRNAILALLEESGIDVSAVGSVADTEAPTRRRRGVAHSQVLGNKSSRQ